MNLNSIINRFFGRDDAEISKNVAKERLRLVLVHDRLDGSEQIMNALRVDLINVIGKYFGIDEKALEVSLSRETDGMALVANIPIRRQKAANLESTEAEDKPAAPPKEIIDTKTPSQQDTTARLGADRQDKGKKNSRPKQQPQKKPRAEQA